MTQVMEKHGLFDTLTQQAERTCQAEAERASAEANAIHSEARTESARRRTDAHRIVAREQELLAERARVMADIEAEKLELSLRHNLAHQALTKAVAEIQRLVDSEAFPAILEKLLEELMRVADPHGTVLAPPKHVEHCKAWLQRNGHANRPVQADPTLIDGVAVHDEATASRITNSLSLRYTKLEDEARRICMERLFGEKGS